MNIPVGTIISDRYEILEKLGSGGMAVVYRALDRKLERDVTIKILRDEFITDDDFKSKFKIEARSAAKLSHPNIVNVYDVGEDGNIYYIVMEYIHGDTLKKAIEEKAPFNNMTTLSISIQIASALSHAHKHHIVHRDIKPQNILLAVDGTVKVTDFGIARAATAATVAANANALGSVHYFSPEQARGGYVDEKSDIYSLGVTMYEMVTGQVPYNGDNSIAIALKHITEEIPDVKQFNPNVSRGLAGIIRKATMKKSDERYANIDLMLADLKTALAEESGAYMPDDNIVEDVTVSMEQEAKLIQEKRNKQVSQEIDYLTANRRRRRSEAPMQEEPEEEPEVMPVMKPVRRSRRVQSIEDPQEENRDLPTPTHSRRIRISKDDSYEEDYEAPPSHGKRSLKQNDDNYDKAQEKKVVIAAVVTALVIIVVISIIGIRFVGGLRRADEKDMVMPQLLGMTLEQAQTTAQEMGFQVVLDGEDYSEDYPEGQIIFQSIDQGTGINQDQEILVKVSLGEQSETMPNVEGMDEADASKTIRDLIGVTPRIEYVNDDEVEVGVVISQSPTEGVTITPSSNIVLQVSKGEEFRKIVVSNYVGKDLDTARSEIEASGLVVGTITEVYSDSVEAGSVVTQTIAVGDEVVTGSTIGLAVSLGPEETQEEPPEESQEQTPEDTTQTPSDTNTPAAGESTKTITFSAPAMGDYGEVVQVRVVLIDSSGNAQTVYSEARNITDFPFNLDITSSGQQELQFYVDDNLQWSDTFQF